MAKSKVEMLTEMIYISAKIKGVMKQANLEMSRVEIQEHCEKLRADFIRPGYKWLLGIEQGVFTEVVKAKKYCSDDVWEMYSLFGEEDLVEVRDLKKALFNFRTAIVSRKRPNFFKLTIRTALLKKLIK